MLNVYKISEKFILPLEVSSFSANKISSNSANLKTNHGQWLLLILTFQLVNRQSLCPWIWAKPKISVNTGHYYDWTGRPKK